jgi:hypothetical protein
MKRLCALVTALSLRLLLALWMALVLCLYLLLENPWVFNHPQTYPTHLKAWNCFTAKSIYE